MIEREVSRYDPSLAVEAASTPPSSWYTDAAFEALDRDAVFSCNWIMAARADQLRTQGEYLTTEIAGEPILLVNDGTIRAFFNVCRHHAAQVAAGEGKVAAFHCPYHGWTYNLDGTLRSTPNLGEARGFDIACSGLVPIACETVGSFVFVCLDPDLPAIVDQTRMGGLRDAMTLEGLQFHERVEYEVGCNWKVYVDNYLDGGYHVPILHRELTSAIDNSRYEVELFERICLQTCPTSSNSPVRSGVASYYWLYPNAMFNFYDGLADINLVLPLGAERCKVIFDFYFDERDEHTQSFIRDSIDVAEKVQREDEMICESVQRGLNSRSYDIGRLSPLKEAGEHLFHRLLHADYTRHLNQINR